MSKNENSSKYIEYKFWVAKNRKDTDTGCWLHKTKPIRDKEKGFFVSEDDQFIVDDRLLPSVNWSNSPVRITLKINKQNAKKNYK